MAKRINDNSLDLENEKLRKLEEAMNDARLDIIQHYDNIKNQIDLRTEAVLEKLPQSLEAAREELLARLKYERDKSLEAIGPNSPLVNYKNSYYEKFQLLKQRYQNCKDDQEEKTKIYNELLELKKSVKLLDEFLEDFKNRTLSFEEADKSVYEALIGELVNYNGETIEESEDEECDEDD